MTVTEDHLLRGARQDRLPGGRTMPVRRCVVVHFTAGATAQSSVNFWKTKAAKGASAHLVIDRDGSIIQCRPFNRTAGHAGISRWRDPNTGKLYTGLNTCSIGIELANAGDNEKLARRWSKLPLVMARHRNGGPEKYWEAYDPRQLVALTKVVQALVRRYRLDDITGHDCIAPERKNDPGPAFPMEQLREACGLSGLPIVFRP
jgi:N-acetylmuramoyl-L-alanine amidase